LGFSVKLKPWDIGVAKEGEGREREREKERERERERAKEASEKECISFLPNARDK
jgi:hypothetical protein